jgi:small subunit ribosomal protein S1
MTGNPQRWDSTPPPPPIDEGYWAALLREGEFSEPSPTEVEPDSASSYHNANGIFSSMDAQNDHERQQDDWDQIGQIMARDETIELTVAGYNRGGLLVEWRSLRGFVPASQLVDYVPPMPNGGIGRDLRRGGGLAGRVGQALRLRVIELSQEQNRLILSERAARAQPGERADLLLRLRPGDVVSGSVTNLCDFGAFVDLGGLEGLIHISELSWGRVGHPNDILRRGTLLRVYVLEVNRDAGRVALSLKRMHPDPWETVGERYEIGQFVQGIVTNVVDFGAFARIEEGLEGLIHVSELAEGHFLHPRNVVSEGQTIVARILSIDGRARRLGLSLRSAE